MKKVVDRVNNKVILVFYEERRGWLDLVVSCDIINWNGMSRKQFDIQVNLQILITYQSYHMKKKLVSFSPELIKFLELFAQFDDI